MRINIFFLLTKLISDSFFLNFKSKKNKKITEKVYEKGKEVRVEGRYIRKGMENIKIYEKFTLREKEKKKMVYFDFFESLLSHRPSGRPAAGIESM